MTSGKGHTTVYPDHLFAWLDLARRRLVTALDEVAADEPEFHTMRPRQLRMLQLIPADGIRVSELAQVAGTTKQAVGQLLTAMERSDLVTSITDPADRRVRLIIRTERGDALDRRINQVMHRAEQVLRAEIGARTYDTMRAGLSRLGSAALHSEPQVQHR